MTLIDQLMPALFLGHGSPMNITEDNLYTQALKKVAVGFPKPQAIVSISAHWLTAGTFAQSSDQPKQIFDFSGFPPELYQVRYTPMGSPHVAGLIQELEPSVQLTQDWGLDHGTWSVLHHLYPNFPIPTLQLSLNRRLSGFQHLELAAKLRPLRNKGVLFLSSGNIVHNLRTISWNPNTAPQDWAVEYESLVIETLENQSLSHAQKFEKLLGSPLFHQAHPTPEHFLPLIYTVGLTEEGKPLQNLSRGIQNGSVSMANFKG